MWQKIKCWIGWHEWVKDCFCGEWYMEVCHTKNRCRYCDYTRKKCKHCGKVKR